MRFFSGSLFLVTLFLLGTLQGHGRQDSREQSKQKDTPTVRITGLVVDQTTKQPLEYATIVLQSTQKKTLITGGITDSRGKFDIKVFSGNYNVKIEYISFKPYELSNQNYSTSTSLGTIGLTLDAAALGEVEIIAEKTEVEIRLDKKIYNVGKDLISQGGSVTDVLDNVPSVSVDVEGTIALRGNENVRILINGKPSALVGINGTDALRQLPAESIEKVEVITSPSARYDAEGTAGILNIILKRSKIQGFNGSMSLNTGYPANAGLSTNLNYRTKKANFFANTGYNYRESPGNSLSENTFLDSFGNATGFTRQTQRFDRIRRGFNAELGLAYYITETSSVTGTILYREGNNNNTNTNNLVNRNLSGLILSQTQRVEPENEDRETVQVSLNYVKDFNDDGHKLTFNFQHENSLEDEKAIVVDTELIGDGSIERESVATREDQRVVLLQGDYVLPIGKNSQFEAGYRGNFRNQTTGYKVAFERDGVFVNDANLSNVLNYKEDVNAFYAQYGSKIEKISYLLGLRVESTRISINQVTTNNFNKKNYINLFPTLNISYELNDKESITLGYNRRIRRPRSRFINPFPSRSSVTSFFQGNPDIDPSYSNALDFGYLKRWKKVTLGGSIYYQHQTQSFNFITRETGETVVVSGEPMDPNVVSLPVLQRTPINLSQNDRYGAEFTLNYTQSKKWRMNGNFNFFQSITKGDFEGQNFDAENVSWFVRFNNIYALPGKINWQTRFNYRGPSETAQSIREGIFSINFGFSKDLFKEKATLSANVNDVLNSRKRKSEFTTQNSISYSEFQWRERSINFNFTYRFNQKKKRNGARQNNTGEDEGFGG